MVELLDEDERVLGEYLKRNGDYMTAIGKSSAAAFYGRHTDSGYLELGRRLPRGSEERPDLSHLRLPFIFFPLHFPWALFPTDYLFVLPMYLFFTRFSGFIFPLRLFFFPANSSVV